MDVEPDQFDALHLLGVVRLQQRRFDEAVGLIQAALRVRPNVVEALSNLAKGLALIGRNDEAVEAFDRALVIRPNDAATLVDRGAVLVRLGRDREALASYQRAIAIDPSNVAARYQLGRLLQATSIRSKVFNFLELDELIQVMDVGAAAIAEVPIYKSLLDNGWAQLNAFEGDDRQIESIKRAYGKHSTIHKEFLFDGSERTLYIANGPSGMTSLLKPSAVALKFFNGFEHFGHIERTERVQTQRLDSILELPLIDFLKMDIQGAELTVLKNGTQKLKNCLAAQLEVSYVCLYENQPPFGEVDTWMRQQGYIPHCFLDVKRWPIAPTMFNNNFMVPGNQLLESDVVYIKDPLRLEQLTEKQLKIFAALAHYCFKSYDLCAFVLRELEGRRAVEPDVHNRYLSALGTKHSP